MGAILADSAVKARFAGMGNTLVTGSPAEFGRCVAEETGKCEGGQVFRRESCTGTTSHLAGEMFKSMSGVNMRHVPYRGSPPAHIDMMSGQVQVMFDTLTGSFPHI